MSYAAEVKKELTALNVGVENAKSELAALVRINGVTNIVSGFKVGAVAVYTENAAIARRIYTLLKKSYGIEVEVVVGNSEIKNSRKRYGVLIHHEVETILTELGIDPFALKSDVPNNLLDIDLKKQSFLRGAFLAAGSVNAPEKANYHLEITTNEEELAELILLLMRSFDLDAKINERKQHYVVYLKKAENIVNFLKLIGSTTKMLKYEDIRIMRDMRNSINRMVNADNANAEKIAVASNEQIKIIQLIDKEIGLEQLPDKLAEIATLRLQFPSESLAGLAQHMKTPISKSGINHRMKKIKQLGEALEKGEQIDLDKL